MPDPLWTPAALAEYLDRNEKTLAEWRYRGVGPKYLKIEHGHIRYRQADVEAWLATFAVTPQGAA